MKDLLATDAKERRRRLVAEVAQIIGTTPSDLSDGGDVCDRACAHDGGTCICIDLYHKTAEKIVAHIGNTVARAQLAEMAKEGVYGF